nr:hypothetical protein [Pseudomonas syringae pv. actinidiae]
MQLPDLSGPAASGRPRSASATTLRAQGPDKSRPTGKPAARSAGFCGNQANAIEALKD